MYSNWASGIFIWKKNNEKRKQNKTKQKQKQQNKTNKTTKPNKDTNQKQNETKQNTKQNKKKQKYKRKTKIWPAIAAPAALGALTILPRNTLFVKFARLPISKSIPAPPTTFWKLKAERAKILFVSTFFKID